MADRIDTPPTLVGDEKAQLQQLWSYLYQMSQAMNNNLEAIGGNELTDSERQVMQKILTGDELSSGMNEMETLKSLIIKTADFVQTSLTEYRLNLLGSTVASGQFGRYVRNTGLDVEVNPEGITQNYSFQEIVKGLKHYEINAKNYIKTGLLRTVSSIPVYGVAIGKDVVTFDENGNETYVDGNKVAELTADELSFWQNGVKVAGYTGSRISFYYNGTECFYIQSGKLYAAADFEINNGKKLIIASGADMEVKSGGDVNVKSGGKVTVESGADLDVNSGGDVNVKSGGKVNIESGADLEVKSGGDLNIKSGGKMSVESGGGMEVKSGGSMEIKSGGDFTVDAGGAVKIQTNNSVNSFIRLGNGNFNADYEGGVLAKQLSVDRCRVNNSPVVTDQTLAQKIYVGTTTPASGNGTLWFMTAGSVTTEWHGENLALKTVQTKSSNLTLNSADSLTGGQTVNYKLNFSMMNFGSQISDQLSIQLSKGGNTKTLSAMSFSLNWFQYKQFEITFTATSDFVAGTGSITLTVGVVSAWESCDLVVGPFDLTATSTGAEQTVSSIKYIP